MIENWRMIAPEMATARLRLRPFVQDDADKLHRILLHPGVRRYLFDDKEVPREQAVAIVEESIVSFSTNHFGLWAVFPQASETLIGFCGFWYFRAPPELELMYGIAPDYWGQGLATEAVKAIIQYGFEVLSFERIVASTDAPNLASVRVMEKAGMQMEKRAIANNLDTLFYSISRDGFQPDTV